MRFVLLAFVIGLGLGAYWLYKPEATVPIVYVHTSTNYNKWIKHIDEVESLSVITTDVSLQLELTSMGETLQALLNSSMGSSLATGTAIIDPCGDTIGYDMHFFRLPTGGLVYYDRDEHAFMTAPPGQYITKDLQACLVTVTKQLKVCSGMVCD